LLARKDLAKRVFPWFIVLVTFGLLVFQLDVKSLSGDEIGNVEIERGSLSWILASMASTWSQHPPASHLVMHFWIRLTGHDDFTVRFPAVCWAVLSIPLLYRLGRRWFAPRVALIAICLFAFAPTLILYGRMEKYYSLVLVLVLASTLLFDRTIRRPCLWLFLQMGLSTLIILYTDYFASLFAVGVQNVIALLRWRRSPKTLAAWLLPQAAAISLFIPFARIAFGQVLSVQGGPEADLASGGLAVVAKLGYFIFSYSVGETILPWMPSAVIGVVLFGGFAVWGTVFQLRSRALSLDHRGLWTVALAGVPLLGSTLLTSTLLQTVPLITLPNHVFFALPFFLLLVAAGVAQAGRLRALVTSMAIVTLIPSLVNYYTGQQFHNPVFVTPSRQVLEYIIDRSEPGDIMVVDPASGVLYYYEYWNLTQPLPVSTLEEVMAKLGSGQAQRVWLITVSRDRTRSLEADPVATWLEQDLSLVETVGFAEQDHVYRAVKARLTGRPAYQYRVVVQLFAQSAQQ
jgi:4-amino-4-deoxy-L-arabinose transferase-like glycosyltransferase